MYPILFFGLPVIGVCLYIWLYRRMLDSGIPSPPLASTFVLFAVYGAVLLFVVSGLFNEWSGAHSLGIIALVFGGAPWTVVQGIILYRSRNVSGYHRAAVVFSFAFPIVLGVFNAGSLAVGR